MRDRQTKHRPANLLLSLLAVACGACAGEGVDSIAGDLGEPVGEAGLAAQTCVTIQRGHPSLLFDANIDSANPDVNYGAADPIGPGAGQHTLFWYNLSSIPSNAVIVSANAGALELGTTTGNISIHRVTAPWTEGTVTWNSLANAFDPAHVTVKVNAAGNAPLVFSIPTLVQQWVDGTYPNNGILLQQASGKTDLKSSENAGGHPRIVVCYTVPTCSDGLQNQGETGVDCGGPCPACGATCSDGVQNQGETGIDCGGPCSGCPALVRHPYIQTLTPTSTILAWMTDVSSVSEVSYGTDPASLNQSASDATLVAQHEVTVSGLTPDTVYYYQVGSNHGPLAGGDSLHFFRTAPSVGTKKKTRAWIVGDSGTGGTNQAAVRDAMLAFAGASPPDLFLHMGDMAYNTGTTSEFTNNFFAVYASVMQNTVTWPTMGNHEGTNSDSGTQTGPYYTAYALPKAGEAGGLPSGTEAYYSFDYGNAHFVVLDSHDSPRTPGGAMLTWMAADLAATTQDWVIAYFHHPPYTKGSHDSDTETQLIEMRQNALPILEAGGVDLVLGGHSHIYERSYLIDGAYNTPTTLGGHLVDGGDGKPLGTGPYVKQPGLNAHDGAVYIVAGHGGAGASGAANHPVMAFSEVANGSCVLDIQDNRLSVVNVRMDGTETDHFSLVKGPGLVLAAPDGGEVLTTGAPFDITWATVGSVSDVTLEYSVDAGANWLPIATVVNTGSYTWAVPSANSAQVLVRVSNAVDASMNDESNGLLALSQNTSVAAIAFGDIWKYHDQGVDQGSAWLALGFDDSLWAQGPGQLGYGDGDEATVLFKAASSYPSDYFRKVVTITGPVLQADLTMLHDDGYAVWVNGTLVSQKYTGNGTSYAVYASQTSSENETTVSAIPLSPSPFVVGQNIIAVMIKQGSASSSDISFDMKLDLIVSGP